LFHIIRNKRLLVIDRAGLLGMDDPDKAGAHYNADNPLAVNHGKLGVPPLKRDYCAPMARWKYIALHLGLARAVSR
jgi:hypothetical protein